MGTGIQRNCFSRFIVKYTFTFSGILELREAERIGYHFMAPARHAVRTAFVSVVMIKGKVAVDNICLYVEWSTVDNTP